MFYADKKEYRAPDVFFEKLITEEILQDTPAPLALSGFGKDEDEGYIQGWF